VLNTVHEIHEKPQKIPLFNNDFSLQITGAVSQDLGTKSKAISKGNGAPPANLQKRNTDLSYPLLLRINCEECSIFFI